MTVTRDRYKTGTGRLTEYAFACGYVERRAFGTVESTMWREGGVYHVRSHDFGTGTRVCWQTFHTLTTARAFFGRQPGGVVRSV